MKKKSLLLFIALSVGVWLAISGGPCWGQGTPSPGPEEDFISGPDLETAISLGDGATWGSVLKVTKTFTASRDNTLFETAQVGADLSDGRGFWVFTGRTGQPPEDGPIRRGLILFDLAAGGIPPNALVTKVTLQLHVSLSAPGSGPQAIALHRLLADWGEGNSNSQGTGGIATPGDATWRHTFFDTAFWTTPGGDFSPTTSSSTLVDGIGFYTWSSIQMVLDVQEWLTAPANNFGWIIRGNETPPRTAKRIDSRQNPTAANHPLLIVEYQPELKSFYLPVILKQ